MPKTLLLADDSVTIQKVVGISFASEDVELVTVDNGDDALAKARELRPDIVLADVVMPGMNGYEVCEAIKADPQLGHVPVLLLTGTFEAFDESRARAAGADGHITKPFEAQALVETVQERLAAAPPAAPVAQAVEAPAAAADTGSAPLAEPAPAEAQAYDFFGDDEAEVEVPAVSYDDELGIPSEPDVAFAFEAPEPMPDEVAPSVATSVSTEPPAATIQRSEPLVTDAPDYLADSPAAPPPAPVLGEPEPLAAPDLGDAPDLLAEAEPSPAADSFGGAESDPFSAPAPEGFSAPAPEGLSAPGDSFDAPGDAFDAPGDAFETSGSAFDAPGNDLASSGPVSGNVDLGAPSTEAPAVDPFSAPDPGDAATVVAFGEPEEPAQTVVALGEPEPCDTPDAETVVSFGATEAPFDAAAASQGALESAAPLFSTPAEDDALFGESSEPVAAPAALETSAAPAPLETSAAAGDTAGFGPVEGAPEPSAEVSGAAHLDPDPGRDYDVSVSDLGAPLAPPPDPDPVELEADSLIEAEPVAPFEAAEPPAPAPAAQLGAPDEAPQTPMELTPELQGQLRETLERVAWEAFGDVTEQLVKDALERIEKVAWEVIPQMAETLIREEIRKLKASDR